MIKRLFDLLSSSIVLIILSPVFLIISLIIKLTSKGPIFFRQKRVGRNNKIFIIYKFRSMYVHAPDVATNLLENSDQFITPIGGFLRKTSLDELPQLLNIIKGEMSVVGPRPALYNQYDLIKLRTELGIEKVLPGLTGWAQINGRDKISIKRKAMLDKEYLDKMSLLFDIQIIFLSIIAVIKKDGIMEGKE